MSAKEQLQQVIDKLGTTEEQVLTTIRASGIKGIPLAATQCVVARWLRAQFDPALPPVLITAAGCSFGYNFEEAVKLPIAVQTVLINFDNKQYPDLIASDPA